MIRADRRTAGRDTVMTQRDRYFHFRFLNRGIRYFHNRLCVQLF